MRQAVEGGWGVPSTARSLDLYDIGMMSFRCRHLCTKMHWCGIRRLWTAGFSGAARGLAAHAWS